MKKTVFVSAMTFALMLTASSALAMNPPGDMLNRDGMVVKHNELLKASHKDVMEKRDERRDAVIENHQQIDVKRDERGAYMKDMEEKVKNAQTPAERQAIILEARAKMAGMQTDIKQTREENRSEIKAKTEDIHAIRIMNVSKVYSAAIERLEKLSTRIASRIEKLSAEGRDVVAAKTALADANTKIVAAKTIFTNLPTTITNDGVYKNAVIALKDSLKSAHQALMDTMKALKGTSNDAGNETVVQ